MDMKFKKTAHKLSSKNIDIRIFEKQISTYRESMRSCLYEIHKAKKELKNAMKNQTDSTRERIAEIKQSYRQIKNELKVLFKEMNTLYLSVA